MKKLLVKAYAKVNLCLDVVGKREDGYHLLKMVMQTISMHDKITIEGNEFGDIRIKSNLYYVPSNDKNIAARAARLFLEEENLEAGLDIAIDKHIPVCAGLGGGSADAAAVIRALYEYFDRAPDEKKLFKMGLELGADVPFALMKGTALAQGIGEKITVLRPMPHCFFVVVKPKFSFATKTIFQNLKIDEIKDHPDVDGMINAINSGDLSAVAGKMANALEPFTLGRAEQIGEIKNTLLALGAQNSTMTGSGSAVIGLFKERESAIKAKKKLVRKHQSVMVCEPIE